MNRGLVYLLRKKPVGWTRLVSRRFTGAKRVSVLLGIGTLLALLVGPQILIMSQMKAEQFAASAESLRLWGPPALLLFALMGVSSGTGGLYFRQSEIDFLFPAPIGRRELLLYHVLGRLLTGLLSSLWLTVFVLRWATHWYWGILGVLFASWFLQLTSELGTLLLSTVSVRFTRWVKRGAWLGVAILLGGGMIVARQQMAGSTLLEAAHRVASSTPVVVVSAPARVFIEAFASDTAGQFAGWGVAGLGVLLLLFGLIVRFDVAYTEGAIRASRLVQERLRRMRSGGSALAAAAPGSARFSVPTLPWLGGAGPLIWRQCIEALRSVRAIVFTGVMTIGFPILFVGMQSDGDGAVSLRSAGFIMVLAMSVFMTQNLALDFRRDVDRMALLKSLPLPPAAVALGQIVPAIVILTVLQGLAFAVLSLAFGAAMPWPPSMLLLWVPFSWLSVALDNVLFLMFPYRFSAAESGQFRFMARAMMVMFVKLVGLLVAGGVAAGVGALLYFVGGRSLLLAAVGATIVLAGAALASTIALGRIFGNYDINKDVAG